LILLKRGFTLQTTEQKRPTSGKELLEAGKDGGIALSGEMIYVVLGYGITLLIARHAGPQILGIYSLSLVILNIAEIFSTLGLKQGCLRYIPLYTSSGQNELAIGHIKFASRASLLLGVIMGLGLFGLSSTIAVHFFKDPGAAEAVKLVALAVPLFALRGIWSFTLQGFKAIKYKVIVERILEPAVRFAAAGIFFFLGMKMLGSVLAILVSVFISAAVAFHFLKKLMKTMPKTDGGDYQIKNWLSFSIPLMFLNLAAFLQPSIPLLLIGYIKGSLEVGIFSAAVKVAAIISLPVAGLNTVFAPRISELHGKGEFVRLRSLYRTLAGWTATIGVLPFLIVVLFAEPVMRFFGSEFGVASDVVKWLAVGHLFSVASGSALCMLVMTGRSKISLMNIILGTIVNLLLNLLLIPPLGIKGAALAATASLALVGVLALIEVFYLLRMQPYGVGSIMPLIAGGIATIGSLLMVRLGMGFSGLALSVPTYLILCWLLSSAEEKDRVREMTISVIRGTGRLWRYGSQGG
jgi:O-antigen/teichoic acid export membrane protein